MRTLKHRLFSEVKFRALISYCVVSFCVQSAALADSVLTSTFFFKSGPRVVTGLRDSDLVRILSNTSELSGSLTAPDLEYLVDPDNSVFDKVSVINATMKGIGNQVLDNRYVLHRNLRSLIAAYRQKNPDFPYIGLGAPLLNQIDRLSAADLTVLGYAVSLATYDKVDPFAIEALTRAHELLPNSRTVAVVKAMIEAQVLVDGSLADAIVHMGGVDNFNQLLESMGKPELKLNPTDYQMDMDQIEKAQLDIYKRWGMAFELVNKALNSKDYNQDLPDYAKAKIAEYMGGYAGYGAEFKYRSAVRRQQQNEFGNVIQFNFRNNVGSCSKVYKL